jgi:hypothetical protein
MDLHDLIALSADPRTLHPDTIRMVMREAGMIAADMATFLDCVTVRQLLRAEAYARADLCARQLGADISAFGDALETLACQIAAGHDGQDWACTIVATHVVATHRATGTQIRCRSAEEFALAVERWAESPYRN